MATKYQVKVELANRPMGEEVEIPGLGIFVNGTERVLTDEEVDTFRSLNAWTEEEFDESGNRVLDEERKPTPSVFHLGPTPDEANLPEGVTVYKLEEYDNDDQTSTASSSMDADDFLAEEVNE